MKHKLWISLVLLAAAGTGLLTGCSLGGSETTSAVAEPITTITDTTFPKGVLINGVDMEGKTPEQALAILSRQQRTIEPFTIRLTLDDAVYTYTEADFAVQNNAEDAVEAARAFLFDGDPMDYYAKKLYLSKTPHEFGAPATLDFDSVKKKLKLLANSLHTEPTEPELVAFRNKKFVYSEGKNGRKILTSQLIEEVEAGLAESNDVDLEIPYKEVKPKTSKEDYDAKAVKLSTFSTISTNNENGNHNMALALQYVNGTILQPGEEFSFNTVVGDSTNDSRGFVKAGVIMNGKSSEDYGGGICQSSTTLYGAALRADMTILERYNHMWPSTYVEIGQDAAIDYGIQDFRFRNDTENPVYIQCGMEDVTLTVTFYGYASKEWDEIAVTSEQTGTIDQPKDEYVEDKSLKKGKIAVYRQGRAGKTASAERIYYKNGKVVKTESLQNSLYPAISTIYHYGPNTKLPSSAQ